MERLSEWPVIISFRSRLEAWSMPSSRLSNQMQRTHTQLALEKHKTKLRRRRTSVFFILLMIHSFHTHTDTHIEKGSAKLICMYMYIYSFSLVFSPTLLTYRHSKLRSSNNFCHAHTTHTHTQLSWLHLNVQCDSPCFTTGLFPLLTLSHHLHMLSSLLHLVYLLTCLLTCWLIALVMRNDQIRAPTKSPRSRLFPTALATRFENRSTPIKFLKLCNLYVDTFFSFFYLPAFDSCIEYFGFFLCFIYFKYLFFCLSDPFFIFHACGKCINVVQSRSQTMNECT